MLVLFCIRWPDSIPGVEFGQIHFAIWANSICKLDKYILWYVYPVMSSSASPVSRLRPCASQEVCATLRVASMTYCKVALAIEEYIILDFGVHQLANWHDKLFDKAFADISLPHKIKPEFWQLVFLFLLNYDRQFALCNFFYW